MFKRTLKSIVRLTRPSDALTPSPENDQERYARMIDQLKCPLDLSLLRRLREKYADPKYAGLQRTKFLDIDYWLTRNMAHADKLGVLDASSPLKVLDLGCGSGFFPYICKQYGQEVVCLDIGGSDVFDDMLAFFGVTRLDKRIEPMTPLDLPWSGFDLVTGLMVKFDAIGEDNRFGPNEWRFILRDLARRHPTRKDAFISSSIRCRTSQK